MWWWIAYYPPERHPRLVRRRATAPGAGDRRRTTADPAPPWLTLLRFRETWGLVVAKFLSDAAWYFYLFWLPKYLYDARGFDIKAVGAFAWIPYAAAGVGCLLGGWFSSWLLTRDLPLDRAAQDRARAERAVMPASCFVPSAPVGWALGHLQPRLLRPAVVVDAGDDPADRSVPAQRRRPVAGLVGFGGAMGGVVFGQVVGYLLDHGFGYGVVFAIAGSLHVLAFVVICLAIPVVHPIAMPLPAPVPRPA